MKFALTVLFLSTWISSTPALAAETVSGTMHCQTSTSYLDVLKDFSIELEESSVGTPDREGKKIKAIYLSATECEDSTELYFKLEDWQKFLAGKKVNVELVHLEPDVKLEAYVSCYLEQ